MGLLADIGGASSIEASSIGWTPRRRPALWAALAVIGGLVVHRAIETYGRVPSWMPWVFLAAAGAAAMLAVACMAWRGGRGAGIAGLFALAGLAGAYGAVQAEPGANDLSRFYPDGIPYAVIEGVVGEGTGVSIHDPAAYEETSELRGRETGERPFVFSPPERDASTFLLDVEQEAATGRVVSGRVKVYVAGRLDVRAGTRVRMTCSLRRPQGARNPGELDMRQVYADRGVFMQARCKSAAAVELVEHTWHAPAQQLCELSRAWMDERIGVRMAERPRMLLACLVLGDKGGLSPELRDDFLRAGTIHVLVVSGMHIMVLGFALLLLCRLAGMGAKSRALLVASVAVVYLVLTGMQVAALRSVVVVVLFALAQLRERRADALNILAVSVIIVLARQPSDLFSAGFQLSYLSVLGLIVLAPVISPRREDTPQHDGGRSPVRLRHVFDSLAATVAATAATLPLVLRGWNILAPVSLLVNLVSLPPLALVLGSALLAPLAFFEPCAVVLAWWFEALLSLLDTVMRWAAELPGGHMYLPSPSVAWIALYYALLIALAVAHMWPRGRMLAPAALVLLLAALPWWPAERGELDTAGGPVMTVLDVGHGACAVVESDAGVMVFDCGSVMRPSVGEWTVAPFLFSRGHDRIDVLALTHADSDHVNGAATLTEKFHVEELWVSEHFITDEESRELLAWLTPRVGRVRALRMGDRASFGSVYVDVLWPDRGFVEAACGGTTLRNEMSMVMRVDLGYARALVCGDAEDIAISGIGERVPVCDILLAPHHASAFDGLTTFLGRVRPGHAIVSGAEGFARKETLENYAAHAQVWRTWNDGAVAIVPTGESEHRYAVTPFVQGAVR